MTFLALAGCFCGFSAPESRVLVFSVPGRVLVGVPTDLEGIVFFDAESGFGTVLTGVGVAFGTGSTVLEGVGGFGTDGVGGSGFDLACFAGCSEERGRCSASTFGFSLGSEALGRAWFGIPFRFEFRVRRAWAQFGTRFRFWFGSRRAWAGFGTRFQFRFGVRRAGTRFGTLFRFLVTFGYRNFRRTSMARARVS